MFAKLFSSIFRKSTNRATIEVHSHKIIKLIIAIIHKLKLITWRGVNGAELLIFSLIANNAGSIHVSFQGKYH